MAILPLKSVVSSHGLVISIATPKVEDASELLDVARRIMSESKHLLTTGDEFKFTVEMQEKRIRDFTEHPDGLLLIAKVNGKIVGMTDFKVGGRRRVAHHGMLGLSFLPEFTGKGLGRLLMNELIAWAKENPRVETLRLQVHAKNVSAVKLYESLGFQVEGREIRGIKFDDGSYDDVLTMALFV
ncbi:GNAT family N-acetyltransferase [Bdellovibrio bacteriovorus]|uniref:GNAT family N-acetyltransferase n=1 Tax=Bdellovibrio bacteriovorus TaxID=959 RepID=UPI0035A6BCA2